MPIEIRELVIKVTVQDDASPGVGVGPVAPAAPPPNLRHWQQELTQACVREVLAELRRRTER
jgi:hypothetical protein